MQKLIYAMVGAVGFASAQSLFLQSDAETSLPDPDLNEQPVIGILTQTLESFMKNDSRLSNYTSYIMSTNVRFMQSHGARVIPIRNQDSKEEIMDKLSKVNAVLFPGGDGDNYDLGKTVFDEIVRRNDAGQFFPAWGTCLGYENMVAYTADAGLGAWGKFVFLRGNLPVKFLKHPMETRMWRPFGPAAFEFEMQNLTWNSHNWGIAPDTFKTDKGLADFWDVTAESFMPNGTAFVASIEAKKYPIFGTQFHPELPSQLFLKGWNLDHSWKNMQLQEQFSRELTLLARQNNNTFGSDAEFELYDISNFDQIDTGVDNIGLAYFF